MDMTIPATVRMKRHSADKGPRRAPARWGEEEPRREVKAYQPDTPTEYSE